MSALKGVRKYVKLQPVVMEGYPDAHNVLLQVGGQQFCVTKNACDTKEEAEWTRDMLCIALANIVRKEAPLPADKQRGV